MMTRTAITVFTAFTALTLVATAAIVTPSASAQDKMGKMDKTSGGKMMDHKMGKMGKMDGKMMKSSVYVCKACKTYVSADAAKKMGYKDPMGHKLTQMAKAPAGYKMATIAGQKSDGKMNGKMSGGKMMGNKVPGKM
jgi:hypothetical protein